MTRGDGLRVGPRDGTLLVRTFRAGVAASAAHDLVLEVTDWHAVVAGGAEPESWRITLEADPESLTVREASGGVAPLRDADRVAVARNIDRKVLRRLPVVFRSTAVRPEGGAARFVAEGELTIAGRTEVVAVRLELTADRGVRAAARLAQTRWGIRPFSALMGAIKVRDEVDVTIEARLPARR
jgi:hypothetical protein